MSRFLVHIILFGIAKRRTLTCTFQALIGQYHQDLLRLLNVIYTITAAHVLTVVVDTKY